MPRWCVRTHRCISALAGLQVDTVILPDGEQHKSMEVLQQVRRAPPPPPPHTTRGRRSLGAASRRTPDALRRP